MADPERLDPTLLAAGQCNEETQLDQLGFGEMLMQIAPQFGVGDVGVPEDGARVSQRDLLAFGVAVRVLELQQIVVISFGQTIPSSLDGSLDPSIVTGDRLGDIHTTQFFQLVIEHAIEKGGPPRLREGVKHRRNVAPDRLTLGTRRAVHPAVLDDLAIARVE